jgi:hypothetical protein
MSHARSPKQREQAVREKMLAHEPWVPRWQQFKLTAAEKERAIKFVFEFKEEWGLQLDKDNFWQWIWYLSIDAIRPRKRGRKPKWSGIDGIGFVLAVDERRADIAAKKGKESLEKSIRAIMLSSPEHYGNVNDTTVETMRQNYFKFQQLLKRSPKTTGATLTESMFNRILSNWGRE